MNRLQIILLSAAILVLFALVYSPHFGYRFPFHEDEWQHITESLQIAETGFNIQHPESGFHLFLYVFSFFWPLPETYQFLPAIWALFGGLILFGVAYQKSGHNFFIAIFSLIFFASLKSNINLLGTWFFVPLTFSIPIIYLYIHLFSEGILRRRSDYLIAALALIILLLPIHAVSVLFSLTFLLIFTLINYRDSLKLKILRLYLLIPVAGLFVYKIVLNVRWGDLFIKAADFLTFERGWGVAERNNSFFETYSFIGYVFAILGVYFLVSQKNYRRQFMIYLLWPSVTIMAIIFYRLTGVSYLVPYQRYFYYFALSLPLLSAFGLFFFFVSLNHLIRRTFGEQSPFFLNGLAIGIIIFVLIGAFARYYAIPPALNLYQVIDQDDYRALKFLSTQVPGKVMANQLISAATYPFTGNLPVGSIYFFGNQDVIAAFYLSRQCGTKREILRKYDVRYVISKEKEEGGIDCDWLKIYDDGDIIYQVK